MELLPCPFCGSGHVLGDGEADDNWFECMDCNARGPRTTYIDAIDIDASEEAWNRRAANVPADPALLALARFGADVIASHRSPAGKWAQPSLLALPDIARDIGVTVSGQFAPGIADAIAALLAPDGAASEEVTDG